MLNTKVIITTHYVISDGLNKYGEEGFTYQVNTLYPICTPFPPISIESLGVGSKEISNYKPHGLIDNIRYINPDNINLELTRKINTKLESITKNWHSFLYLTFSATHIIYERSKCEIITDIGTFVNDWLSRSKLPETLAVLLIKNIENKRFETKNASHCPGFIFTIKNVDNSFIIENTYATKIESVYRGSIAKWWLE